MDPTGKLVNCGSDSALRRSRRNGGEYLVNIDDKVI